MSEENRAAQVTYLLQQAREAKAQRDWPTVKDTCIGILCWDPSNEEANRLYAYARHSLDPGYRPGENDDYLREHRPPASRPYGAWDDSFTMWNRGVYLWDVFISYANAEPDATVAARMATWLANTGFYTKGHSAHCRVFFAPRSLGENLYLRKGVYVPSRGAPRDKDAVAWSAILRHNLLRCYHYIGLVSDAFKESPFCELEFQAFRRITAGNPRRTLTLIAAGEDDDDRLWRPDMDEYRTASRDALTRLLGDLAHLGELCEPRIVYQQLPLADLGPEAYAWDDFEHGPDPPRKVFEDWVREIMVRIMKGMDPSAELPFEFPFAWQEHHAKAAVWSAVELLRRGVSPFQ